MEAEDFCACNIKENIRLSGKNGQPCLFGDPTGPPISARFFTLHISSLLHALALLIGRKCSKDLFKSMLHRASLNMTLSVKGIFDASFKRL